MNHFCAPADTARRCQSDTELNKLSSKADDLGGWMMCFDVPDEDTACGRRAVQRESTRVNSCVMRRMTRVLRVGADGLV